MMNALGKLLNTIYALIMAFVVIILLMLVVACGGVAVGAIFYGHLGIAGVYGYATAVFLFALVFFAADALRTVGSREPTAPRTNDRFVAIVTAGCSGTLVGVCFATGASFFEATELELMAIVIGLSIAFPVGGLLLEALGIDPGEMDVLGDD